MNENYRKRKRQKTKTHQTNKQLNKAESQTHTEREIFGFNKLEVEGLVNQKETKVGQKTHVVFRQNPCAHMDD